MKNIVCVKHGTQYPAEYVNILADMVLRNLDKDTAIKFICFTDDPTGLDIDIDVRPLPGNLEGWWNKLYLFKNDLFPDGDQILYLDLKNVIVSALDDVLAYEGRFCLLRDFYRADGMASGIMSWKSNTLGYIWNNYVTAGYPHLSGGDQEWIEKCCPPHDFWQDLFSGQFVSYKGHNCITGIPRGAKIVFFHGEPRPDQIKDGWVPQVWKIGGGTSLELMSKCNTSRDDVIDNIRHNLTSGVNILSHAMQPHDGHAVIVGGAPSIRNFIEELKMRVKCGQNVVALNNSWRWCEENGIHVNSQVMVDARWENIDFVPPEGSPIHRLYATQCNKLVTDFAGKDCLTLWNSLIMDLVPEFDKTNHMFWIGAGTTVGIRSIFLMFALGYREFHLYGFDSCYDGEQGHAYPQTLNVGERVVDVALGDRKFKAAPWMISQVHDFLETAEYFTGLGCVFTIHGDGLLQYAAQTGLMPIPVEDRADSILQRLEGMENPVGVEVGVFTGEMSRRLLRRQDLTLHMVDSWIQHSPESEYGKTDYHGKLDEGDQERCFQNTVAVTNFAGERAKIIRKDSLAAADEFDDESLDFVFLDADHTYDAIKKDIEAWSKKVKKNCIFGGHDYDHPLHPTWGVKRAVDEFCNDNGYQLELGKDYTWFVKIT